MNIEFVHELLAVFFYRFDADGQNVRDLFVGVAFGHQLQHFSFPGSEMVSVLSGAIPIIGIPALLQQAFGDARAEEGIAIPGFANCLNQIL